jgi:2-phosphoglycolate phosphatase
MAYRTRGIIFDLDGTLIDSGGDIVAALNHALRRTGREALPASTVLGFVGDGAPLLCARALGLPEKHAKVGALLGEYLAYYNDHATDHTRWMPHARRVLDELAGFPLALCTNKPRLTTDVVLARLGVRSLFSAVVAGGDTPLGKPSPEPVLELARVLDLDPAELVMVGDGPQDVEAGRRAGARTVGVRGGIAVADRLSAARPDVLIDSLAELLAIVARWAAPAAETA